MTLLFSIIPRLALSLNPGMPLRAFYTLLRLEYFALSRHFFTYTTAFALPVRHHDHVHTLWLTTKNDLSALTESFTDHAYAVPLKKGEVQIILDLGANFGESALAFHLRYPDARIYAIEPAPASYERLARLAETVPEITPVQAALATESGTIDMYTFKQYAMRNATQPRDGYDSKVTVPAMTFAALLDQYHITVVDILKFDIEGGEDALCNTPSLMRVQCLVGEYHADLAKTPADVFVASFEKAGFSVTPPVLKGNKFLLQGMRL